MLLIRLPPGRLYFDVAMFVMAADTCRPRSLSLAVPEHLGLSAPPRTAFLFAWPFPRNDGPDSRNESRRRRASLL